MKMQIIKKIFVVLLILDFISMLATGITMIPSFKGLAEYGAVMLGMTIALTVIAVGVTLFEVIAKLFLIRSTAPGFSWVSGRKGYRGLAKVLLIFNFAAILINLFSLGGEGATLFNQVRICVHMLAALVEIITVFCYLRASKKLHAEANAENS